MLKLWYSLTRIVLPPRFAWIISFLFYVHQTSVLVGLLHLERWLGLWELNLCRIYQQLPHICKMRYVFGSPILLYADVYLKFVMLMGPCIYRLLLAEEGHPLRQFLV